jgi:hypothetical protein
MDWMKRLKSLARINAEAPPSLIERTWIKTWVETATIKRTTVKWREKGKNGDYEHASKPD